VQGAKGVASGVVEVVALKIVGCAEEIAS